MIDPDVVARIVAAAARRAHRLGVLIFDPHGGRRFLHVDDTVCEMWGRSREEITAAGFQAPVWSVHEATTRRRIDDLLEGRTDHFDEEIVFERPDGTLLWARVYAERLDEPGDQTRTVTVLEDITDLRSAPEGQPPVHEFDRAFARSVVGAALISADGSMLRVNDALCRLLNVDRADLLGNGYLAVRVIGDFGFGHRAWQRITDGDDTAAFDITHEGRDGVQRELRVALSATRDPAGRLQHAYLQTVDLTGTDQAEFVSRQFESLSEHSALALIGLDLDGTITSWSGGAERLYGYSASEVIGKPISIFYRPGDPDPSAVLADTIRNAAEGRNTVLPGIRPVRSDGETLIVDAVATPVRDSDGRLTGLLCVYRDVSAEERIRAERDAMWDLSEDFMTIATGVTVSDANPSFCRAVGLPREQVVGRDARDFIADDFDYEQVRRTASSGEPYEMRMKAADGTLRWVRWNTQFAGNISYSVGNDITDLVEARDRLQSSERMLRSITHSTGQALIVVDDEHRVVFWSDGARRMHGAAAGDMIGRPITTIFSRGSQAALAASIDEAFEQPDTHTPSDTTARVVREDGQRVDVEASATAWRDETGRLRCTVMLRDVTERLRVQREARQLERVLQASPDAVVISTLDGKIVSANFGAEQLLGASVDEIAGKSCAQALDDSDVPFSHDEIRAEMLAGRTVTFELYLDSHTSRDGVTHVSVTIVPLPDESGEVTATATILTDVSEREALRERNARAEAAAELVSGLQRISDAALDHRGVSDLARAVLPLVADLLADRPQLGLIALSVDGPGSALCVQESFGATAPRAGSELAHSETVTAAFGLQTVSVSDSDDGTFGCEGCVLWAPVGTGKTEALMAFSRDHAFTAEEAGVVGLAADRISSAMRHVERREREVTVSETLQRSLLPDRLPDVPGVRLSARYLPGGEGNVGGDWYDALASGNGKLLLVIGDVAGSGLQTASMMGNLRSALRAYAIDSDDPVTLLQSLDRLLRRHNPGEMATAAIIAIDLADGRTVTAAAGHPPPLLARRADGHVDAISEPSPPLGAGSQEPRAAHHDRLEPGDMLLLYTDGLMERRAVPLEQKMRELRATFAGTVNAGCPQRTCDLVADRLLSDSQQRADDVALLAAAWEPEADDRLLVTLPADMSSLVLARATVRRWLGAAGVSDTEIGDITLAVGEAATNAIEHAYSLEDNTFDISGTVDHDPSGRATVTVTVSDHGTWRQPRGEGRGMGSVNIRAVMDDVDVRNGPDGTAVTMRRVVEARDGGR